MCLPLMGEMLLAELSLAVPLGPTAVNQLEWTQLFWTIYSVPIIIMEFLILNIDTVSAIVRLNHGQPVVSGEGNRST